MGADETLKRRWFPAGTKVVVRPARTGDAVNIATLFENELYEATVFRHKVKIYSQSALLFHSWQSDLVYMRGSAQDSSYCCSTQDWLNHNEDADWLVNEWMYEYKNPLAGPGGLMTWEAL